VSDAPPRRLLIVHHTSSPALQELLQAVIEGTHAEEIEGVETVVRPALAASVVDVLESDGFLLGTPANIGYMSGALKHFFDQVYYPCLNAKPFAPYGLYVHGNNEVVGAVRAIESITKAMGWRLAHEVVGVIGPPAASDRHACWDLGATLAASLMPT
jgi:NAD(P)H-dependent FMN reductase